jgi:hypothetical protein
MTVWAWSEGGPGTSCHRWRVFAPVRATVDFSIRASIRSIARVVRVGIRGFQGEGLYTGQGGSYEGREARSACQSTIRAGQGQERTVTGR